MTSYLPWTAEMFDLHSNDHPADFAGRARNVEERTDENRAWSERKKMTCFLICSVSSWLAVLSPIYVFG
jgi:hypothetical protein